jgi:hypothetical protein
MTSYVWGHEAVVHAASAGCSASADGSSPASTGAAGALPSKLHAATTTTAAQAARIDRDPTPRASDPAWENAAVEDPPPPTDDDLVAQLERTAEDIAANAEAPDAGALAARLEHIVDLLIHRGHLQPSHRRLLDRIAPLRGASGQSRPMVRLAIAPDKPVVSPDIDCAALLHLCKARCCSLKVDLTADDVAAHEVEWELHEPYLLKRNRFTGYCHYLKPDGGCEAYHHRPTQCRQYDCRQDSRVWLDWENKVPRSLEGFAINIPLDEWPEE